MSKKHGYCGKCMFCVSVCPECNSTDVDVSGLISFSYSNHLQDDIDMSLEFDYIKGFYCNECNTDINPEKLESAISETLPDTLKAKRKDGNIVTISI
jgi:ferredoxin